MKSPCPLPRSIAASVAVFLLFGLAALPRPAHAQNAPPVIVVNAGLTLPEGGTAVIGATQLLVSDTDNPPSDLVYTVSAPAHGVLLRTGIPVGPSGNFTQQDIDDGLISYEHDGSETTSDSFAFFVSDGNGGTAGPATFAITVIPVNDPPVLEINAPLSVETGGTATITTSELLVTDADNTASQLTYTLVTAPAHGTLKRSSIPLGQGDSFTQADIDNSNMTYTHDGDGATSDAMTFTVSDPLGATIPPFTFAVEIVPVTGVDPGGPPTSTRVRAGPNPFHAGTTIQYAVSRGGPVTLRVYDLSGAVVATPVNGRYREPGRYTVRFGLHAAPGVYFVRLDAAGVVRTAKLFAVR